MGLKLGLGLELGLKLGLGFKLRLALWSKLGLGLKLGSKSGLGLQLGLSLCLGLELGSKVRVIGLELMFKDKVRVWVNIYFLSFHCDELTDSEEIKRL